MKFDIRVFSKICRENPSSNWGIFMKFDTSIFKNYVEKIHVPIEGFSWNLIYEYFSKIRIENPSSNKNLKIITGILYEEVCTLTAINRSFILRMRNVSANISTENQNTRFVISISPLPPPNHVVHDIIWKKNMVQLVRSQMAVQYGACVLHAVYLRLQTHTRNT